MPKPQLRFRLLLPLLIGCGDGAPDDVIDPDTVPTEPGETDLVDTDAVDTDAPDTDPADTDPADTEPTDTDPTDTDPADTDPPATLYPAAVYDCSLPLPSPPFTWREVRGVETTEDIAFDTQGNLIGSVLNGPIAAWRRNGNRTLVAAPGETRGLDLLPDGRLIVSDPDLGVLNAIDITTGAITLHAILDVGMAGIDVDADGWVYASSISRIPASIYAVRPDGDFWRFSEIGPDSQGYGVALSPDELRLYSSRYNAAEIWVSDRQPGGAFGAATRWTTGTGVGFAGMVTDTCGNLYAMDAFRCDVWRFDPTTGAGEVIFSGRRGLYCANLAFGRGLGGFGATQLYVSTYEAVIEIDYGVPGRPR